MEARRVQVRRPPRLVAQPGARVRHEQRLHVRPRLVAEDGHVQRSAQQRVDGVDRAAAAAAAADLAAAAVDLALVVAALDGANVDGQQQRLQQRRRRQRRRQVERRQPEPRLRERGGGVGAVREEDRRLRRVAQRDGRVERRRAEADGGGGGVGAIVQEELHDRWVPHPVRRLRRRRRRRRRRAALGQLKGRLGARRLAVGPRRPLRRPGVGRRRHRVPRRRPRRRRRELGESRVGIGERVRFEDVVVAEERRRRALRREERRDLRRRRRAEPADGGEVERREAGGVGLPRERCAAHLDELLGDIDVAEVRRQVERRRAAAARVGGGGAGVEQRAHHRVVSRRRRVMQRGEPLGGARDHRGARVEERGRERRPLRRVALGLRRAARRKVQRRPAVVVRHVDVGAVVQQQLRRLDVALARAREEERAPVVVALAQVARLALRRLEQPLQLVDVAEARDAEELVRHRPAGGRDGLGLPLGLCAGDPALARALQRPLQPPRQLLRA